MHRRSLPLTRLLGQTLPLFLVVVCTVLASCAGGAHATVMTPTPPCPGDCDRNDRVTIGEVIRAVRILLGDLPLSDCPPIDISSDLLVSIDEVVAAVDAALTGCPEADVCFGVPPAGGTSLTTVTVATGLSQPLYVTAPPGDVNRIFIVEQRGRIRIVKDGELLPTPFLDLSAAVNSGGERGLFSLAFHPAYAENGEFFVDYTKKVEDDKLISVVSRLRVSDDPNVADPSNEEIILEQIQPGVAHNGGQLLFDPHGYLYISFGDGGFSASTQNNAQDPGTWLGKILRIDVDGGVPYAIPPDNPFVGAAGTLEEIWTFGLRNPWRVSVDPLSDTLYIGDVGEQRFEEINVQPSDLRGANYGWCCREGRDPFAGPGPCFQSASTCPAIGLQPPAVQYDHGTGCSVSGGFVYRGCAMPDLHGTYFYGDYCNGFVRSFVYRDGMVEEERDWTAELAPTDGQTIDQIAGFGVDARGELYICDFQGQVFKIVPLAGNEQ